MSIASGIRYNKWMDSIDGFVDDGEQRSNVIADQAVVTVVRGVRSKWKQPIGYYLVKTAFSAEQQKRIFTDIFAELLHHGITVIAVVCDLQGTQWKTWRSLGVSHERPFIEVKVQSGSGEELCISSHRVFVLCDVPHLLKCTRNNLLNYKIKSSLPEPACFDVLRLMWNAEERHQLNVVPKLTQFHLNPSSLQRMKVKYAAQLMSRKVAAGLRIYAALNKLPSRPAEGTAQFVEKIDELFDMLNSSSPAHPGQKKALMAHVLDQFLSKLDSYFIWISSWTFHGKRERETMPFKEGWLITIRAMQAIVTYLIQEHKFSFVCTRQFNQDVCENLFGKVRQKLGCNDHPASYMFAPILRRVSQLKYLSSNPDGHNCEEEEDQLLVTLHDNSDIQQCPQDDTKKEVLDSAESFVRSDVSAGDSVSDSEAAIAGAALAERRNLSRASKSSAISRLYTDSNPELGGEVEQVESSSSSKVDLQPAPVTRHPLAETQAFDDVLDQIVLYLSGYCVQRILQKLKVLGGCETCASALTRPLKEADIIIIQKQYSGCYLTVPSLAVVSLLQKLEKHICACLNTHQMHIPALKTSLLAGFQCSIALPACHNSRSRILEMYTILRLNKYCKNIRMAAAVESIRKKIESKKKKL